MNAASRLRYFAVSENSFIASSIDSPLFEAAPSVPSARRTPAAVREAASMMPEASFRFELGQETAVTPRRASSAKSSGVQ